MTLLLDTHVLLWWLEDPKLAEGISKQRRRRAIQRRIGCPAERLGLAKFRR